MKVLIVHPQMALYGGAEIVIVKLAKYLQAHGHKASILTLTTAEYEDYKGLDIIIPPFDKERIQWRPRNGSLSTLKELYSIYRNLQILVRERIDDYDIANTHNFPALWTIPSNKPVLHQCNEVPDLWHNQKVSSIVNPFLNIGRFGDRVISNSKNYSAIVADVRMSQIFQHRYKIKPTVVHYGIDSEYWGETNYKVDINVSPESFTILVPSMVTPSKRQLEILQALNVLKHKIVDIKVIFTGYKEKKYTEMLNEYINENNLQEYVMFTGLVNHDTLRSLYHLSNVAVFAGRGQGSWLGGFESLATGTPIIVSPKLTCSEIIKKEHLGIVSDNFVDSIKEIYLHQEHYNKNVKWQRDWVKQNLTWDKYCEQVTNLMKAKIATS